MYFYISENQIKSRCKYRSPYRCFIMVFFSRWIWWNNKKCTILFRTTHVQLWELLRCYAKFPSTFTRVTELVFAISKYFELCWSEIYLLSQLFEAILIESNFKPKKIYIKPRIKLKNIFTSFFTWKLLWSSCQRLKNVIFHSKVVTKC